MFSLLSPLYVSPLFWQAPACQAYYTTITCPSVQFLNTDIDFDAVIDAKKSMIWNPTISPEDQFYALLFLLQTSFESRILPYEACQKIFCEHLPTTIEATGWAIEDYYFPNQE